MVEHFKAHTAEFLRRLTQCERRLESYVLALVPNWEDAEDILQETKLRLWEQYEEYDATKDFGAWACTIAYYQVLTHRHRSQAKHRALSLEFLERVSAEVARSVERNDTRTHALRGCLEKLRETKRTLLERCYSGEKAVALAAELGRSADSVRQELMRIRRQVHRCIDAALRRGRSS